MVNILKKIVTSQLPKLFYFINYIQLLKKLCKKYVELSKRDLVSRIFNLK